MSPQHPIRTQRTRWPKTSASTKSSPRNRSAEDQRLVRRLCGLSEACLREARSHDHGRNRQIPHGVRARLRVVLPGVPLRRDAGERLEPVEGGGALQGQRRAGPRRGPREAPCKVVKAEAPIQGASGSKSQAEGKRKFHSVSNLALSNILAVIRKGTRPFFYRCTR